MTNQRSSLMLADALASAADRIERSINTHDPRTDHRGIAEANVALLRESVRRIRDTARDLPGQLSIFND